MLASLIAAAFLVFVAGLMLHAALCDLRTMTIPNGVGLALLAGFALYAPVSGLGLPELGLHVAAGAGVLAVGFALFAFGVLGGGDAKLYAAGALWLASALTEFLVLSVLAGGLLSIALLVARKVPLPVAVYGWAWTTHLLDRRQGVPYGLAIAAGALAALPHTALWRQALGA